MKHLITLVLLALTAAAYGQQTAPDSTAVMSGFPIVMGCNADATVTFHADSCRSERQSTEQCDICMEFAMADSTICISDGGEQKELRIIDYTEWQPFEDYEEPWEMQDPLLFYRGYKKYFMAKERGRRDPYDISMYRTADGSFCIVIDDCKGWRLLRPTEIVNIEQ